MPDDFTPELFDESAVLYPASVRAEYLSDLVWAAVYAAARQAQASGDAAGAARFRQDMIRSAQQTQSGLPAWAALRPPPSAEQQAGSRPVVSYPQTVNLFGFVTVPTRLPVPLWTPPGVVQAIAAQGGTPLIPLGVIGTDDRVNPYLLDTGPDGFIPAGNRPVMGGALPPRPLINPSTGRPLQGAGGRGWVSSNPFVADPMPGNPSFAMPMNPANSRWYNRGVVAPEAVGPPQMTGGPPSAGILGYRANGYYVVANTTTGGYRVIFRDATGALIPPGQAPPASLLRPGEVLIPPPNPPTRTYPTGPTPSPTPFGPVDPGGGLEDYGSPDGGDDKEVWAAFYAAYYPDGGGSGGSYGSKFSN